MKLSVGQLVSLVLALGFAALLIYDAPFIGTADAASSQVVYAPVYNPPLFGTTPGHIDVLLLLLELAFVAFVGGAIFFATSQQKKGD
jgi:hypothetical protein